MYILICVGFGGYIASEKGRKPGEGVLFALFFGPLGLIIAACMPTVEKAPPGPDQEDEDDAKVRANFDTLALQRLDNAEPVRKRRQDAK